MVGCSFISFWACEFLDVAWSLSLFFVVSVIFSHFLVEGKGNRTIDRTIPTYCRTIPIVARFLLSD